jgi:hypothetical protein
VLGQVADLHEAELLPHRLLRMDEIANDPGAITQALADTLGIGLRGVPPSRLGGSRFPAGHWRAFSESLADAFAVLGPVARRLGYAST